MSSTQSTPLSIHWELNNLEKIQDTRLNIIGTPQLIDTPLGKAMEFNGINEGIELNANPLANATEFTLELIFKPYDGGLFEQTTIQTGHEPTNRVFLELNSDMLWFLTTELISKDSSVETYAEMYLHPSNKWYHYAMVYKNNHIANFVNGTKELATDIKYNTASSGKTYIGVCSNYIFWYKGIIKTVKITHKALSPTHFILKDVDILNKK